jgi:hypothetical protein
MRDTRHSNWKRTSEHLAATIRDAIMSRKDAYEADRYGNRVIVRYINGQTFRITVEDIS